MVPRLHQVAWYLCGLATPSVTSYEDHLIRPHGGLDVGPVLVDGKLLLITTDLYQFVKLEDGTIIKI